MVARETLKNLTEAKHLEQQAVAAALLRVVVEHHVCDERLSECIRRLQAAPHLYHISSLLHLLRSSLSSGGSPFLNDLSLAIFDGAPLFEALHKAVDSLPQPMTTLDLFEGTRRAAEAYIDGTGASLWYCLRHPRFLWSAAMSTSVGGRLFGSLSPFDPKAFAGNSSGRLFKEKFCNRHGDFLELDWTVGPTPTVGDRMAPEAMAAIAGLRSSKSICFPHTRWIYVNLQNRRGMSEGRRSQALFDASQTSSGIFRLASVSVDAPFYRGSDRRLMTLRDHQSHLLGELKKGLTPSRSSWYAFALMEGEHGAWWRCVEEVVEKAFFLSEMTDHPIAVFHELVVLGLVRAWQGFCCRSLTGSVMSTVACKECVDRGGSVNAAYVWALGDDGEKHRACAVQAVLWGRPLLARQRLIERSRTRGFEALVRCCMPTAVHQYLEEIWNAACLNQWQKRGPVDFS